MAEPLTEYRVIWEIDLEDVSAAAVTRQALEKLLDPSSRVRVFTVFDSEGEETVVNVCRDQANALKRPGDR